MMKPAELVELLEDVSGLSGGDLFEKGFSIYRDLYLAKGRVVGVEKTHDGHILLFHEDRFEHAFQTTSDRLCSPDRKDIVDAKRIARIRWIRPVVTGQVTSTACFEVPSPTGRSRPPNRLYVVESELYVVWLEPRTSGGWKFSSAYPATRDGVERYKRGGRTVGRW
jgi:hypothetical protein